MELVEEGWMKDERLEQDLEVCFQRQQRRR